jgi:hypothetical protein
MNKLSPTASLTLSPARGVVMAELKDRLQIVPLMPDRWDDFETLFGRQGACYGCWCTYFRLAPKQRKANSASDNKAFIRARIEAGPPPGLIGYVAGEAVAWMQIGPRADVPQFNNAGRVCAPLEDAPATDDRVWAISCFFAKSAMRGQGLSHEMVAAGIDHARANRRPPAGGLSDGSGRSRRNRSASSSARRGSSRRPVLAQVALRKTGRPLMRFDL